MTQEEELKQKAVEIRDAQLQMENTARRIGLMFLSVIEAYKLSSVAATTISDGYMTMQHAKDIQSAKEYISATAVPTFVQIQSDLQTHAESLLQLAQELLDNEGKTTANTESLLSLSSTLQDTQQKTTANTESIGAHNTRLQTLESRDVSANQQRDGYMTKEMVFDLETTRDATLQLATASLGSSSDEYSYEIILTLGQFGSKTLSLPVHGGGDGMQPSQTPALLDPEAFLSVVDYINNMDNLHRIIGYLPQSFFAVEEVAPEDIIHRGTTDNGEVIFDSKSHNFLLRVYGSARGLSLYKYYDSATNYPLVGAAITPGRIYIASATEKTYIGIVRNLVELTPNSGGAVEPEPPVPPAEVYTTGGGADESVFVGVIGGGGADESYFS